MSIFSSRRMTDGGYRRCSRYLGRATRAGAVVTACAAVMCLAPTRAIAQAPQVDPAQVAIWDVVETTGGNVLKGVIVEHSMTANGMVYKLVLPGGGGTLTIPDNSVKSITKEPNPAKAQAAQAPPAAAPPGYATAAPPAAAPAYPPAAAPAYPQAGVAPQPAPYPGTPEKPGHIDLAPPMALEGWRFSFQIAPYFPMSDLSTSTGGGDLADIGYGGRVRLGYEFMFGRFGVTPSLAVESALFSLKTQNTQVGSLDGGALYVGAQPGIQLAVHIGRVAPFAGMTFGFDHYEFTGKFADVASQNGYHTAGNGFGFGVLFGLDVLLTTKWSLGLGAEIHPGFTSVDPGQGAPSSSMAHTALLFGATFMFGGPDS